VTSQKTTSVTEVSDLRLLIGSGGATLEVLRAAGRRPVPNSPFGRSVRFLRGQECMNAMGVFLQGQNPLLLIHDTEELLEKFVILYRLA